MALDAVTREIGAVELANSSNVPLLDQGDLQRITAAIVVTDAAGRIVATSPRAARMLESGRQTREVASWSIADGRRVAILEEEALPADGQEPLRQALDRFRFVTDAFPTLMSYVDADLRYVWANESYRRWFGRPPEEIFGLTVAEVLGRDAWARIEHHAASALAGKEVTFVDRLVYSAGPARDIRATYVPHRDEDGRVRGFAALVHDISEIKAAEAALRRSERFLEESQAAAHVGSWELTLDGAPPTPDTKARWSEENYRIFGLDASVETTAGTFFAAVHPDDKAAMLAASRAGLARGEPFEKECRIVRPDGSIRFIHGWTSVERDASGKLVRLVGTAQDITERKKIEHELREADRRKDEFVAMLSHELRNPLAPILTAVELWSQSAGGSDEPPAPSVRAVISRQAHHMKRLLDDLLDVSRVSQGKIQLQRAPVDLNRILGQSVEMSRAQLAEKRQDLCVDLVATPLPLDADPTRLIQVFTNLLSNAVKYTDRGGQIRISSHVEDGDAVVRVKDSGIGMREELLVGAFDLFVQDARSFDRAQGGLGIGLTMVRTLVKMHGGSVQAFSEGPGRGSELVVRLPLAPDVLPSLSRTPSTSESPFAPRREPVSDVDQRSLRMLVVDDNADAAGTVGALLEVLGHHVTIASDGPSALAAAARTAFDVVLLDIGLPGMDGYSVAARLRRAGNDRTVLIAVTGYGQEEHLRRSAEAGFDHHLVKPIELAKLRALLASVERRASGDA